MQCRGEILADRNGACRRACHEAIERRHGRAEQERLAAERVLDTAGQGVMPDDPDAGEGLHRGERRLCGTRRGFVGDGHAFAFPPRRHQRRRRRRQLVGQPRQQLLGEPCRIGLRKGNAQHGGEAVRRGSGLHRRDPVGAPGVEQDLASSAPGPQRPYPAAASHQARRLVAVRDQELDGLARERSRLHGGEPHRHFGGELQRRWRKRIRAAARHADASCASSRRRSKRSAQSLP